MPRKVVPKKKSRTATRKPVARRVGKAKSKARKPNKATAAKVAATMLPSAMTGRASPAKAAEGDEPVFAYIRWLRSRNAALPNASMPWQPGRYQP